MASGINNIHQPGTCNGSKAARSSSAEECNREMHIKMCKKIAQLTKVSLAVAVFPRRWGCPGRGCQGIVSSDVPVWEEGGETWSSILGCCREHRYAQSSLHSSPAGAAAHPEGLPLCRAMEPRTELLWLPCDHNQGSSSELLRGIDSIRFSSTITNTACNLRSIVLK